MRNLLVISGVLCLVVAVASVCASDSTAEHFSRANELYEQKEFESAIAAYLRIIESGVESAPVYFNLGNAYFKLGDLGHAVLYYHRAKRLEPSNEDIRHNLEFARQFARVQMEGVELNPIKTFFVSLVDQYRLDTLAWMSSALFILFVLVLLVRYGLGIPGVVLRIAMTVTLILVLAAVGLTTFKYRHEFLTRRAVIVAEDAPVQTGPSEQSDLELQGAPGLVVEIVDQSGEYLNVLFENKRRGWIKRNLVAEI